MDISKFFSILLLSAITRAVSHEECVTSVEEVGRSSGNNISYHSDSSVLSQIEHEHFADYEMREIRICGENQRVNGMSI